MHITEQKWNDIKPQLVDLQRLETDRYLSEMRLLLNRHFGTPGPGYEPAQPPPRQIPEEPIVRTGIKKP